MQTKPTGWDALFSAAHKTEYKFIISGTTYTAQNIQGTPIITKPYMDKLCIGRCCSGTLKIQIRPINGTAIPKAAEVVAYCRLTSSDKQTVTDWMEQGHYYISARKQRGELLSLVCRDAMMKAGTEYLSRTAFTEWPTSMTDVVTEIATLMGIAVDSRTEIYSGSDYVVSYPNDLLMSEVLSMIAAAHGGNFVITEQNKLRLIPVAAVSTLDANKCVLYSNFKSYDAVSSLQQIRRGTLEDDAGNQYSAGDDTGVEITAKCNYATQAIADKLCNPDSASRGVLYGVEYIPYALKGAYVDPCVELGDTVSLSVRDFSAHRMVGSMTIRCNISYNADISCQAEADDEDEYPYIDARSLQASRYIRTDQKYFGNRIDRVNGFTSEYTVNGQVVARLLANSNVFSMQRMVNGAWQDCIYFDAATQKYVIAGEVTLTGVVTEEGLSNGTTTINGGCIKTGTIDANKVTVTNISASNITSGSIDASKIQVTNLNASNITSGKISADYIDASTLRVSKLYAGSSSNVAITSISTETLYIGGDGTWNYKYLNVFADTIQFKQFSSGSTSMLVMDVGCRCLRPNADRFWDLGNVLYGFGALYIEDVLCRNGTGNCGSDSYPFSEGFIKKLYLGKNCYLTADGVSLCVNGTAIGGESKISKLYAGTTTYYAELNSSYAFVPSTVTYDFTLGSSSYPWKKAYITKLYLNGTEFTPQTIDTSKISYSSLIYASLNSSKQFIPSGTGYYLGSSTYPWQYAYITNLYLNGTKFDPASIGTDMSGKEFKMGGSSSYYMTANTSREFRPNTSSTTYPFYLGTTTYYWHYAYLGSNTVKIGSTASSKIGFFAGTPLARQTLSSTSQNMGYSTATASNYLKILNNLVGILVKYGLIGT